MERKTRIAIRHMNTQTFSPHRHDLEVLRAIAMVLIILFHGSLSFFDSPWPIQDSQRNETLAVIFLVIHGFEMPLFFVMSGFFHRNDVAYAGDEGVVRASISKNLHAVGVWSYHRCPSYTLAQREIG